MRNGRIVLVCALLLSLGAAVWATGAQEGTAASKQGATKELTFDTFVADHQSYYESMAEEFNKEFPDEGLVLKMTTSPTDQLHDKLLLSLAAGTGAPDIFDMNIQWSGQFLKQNPEYFVPLDDIVAKHKQYMHPERIKTYTDPQGHVLGLPTHIGAGVMYYNQEQLQAAGINPNSIRLWSDWVQAGQKAAQPDQGIWWSAHQNVIAREFALLTMQNGGYLIDPQGKITVDEPPAVEALQFIYDNVHTHRIATIAPNGNFHDPNFYPIMNAGKIYTLPYAQWYMIRFKNFMTDLSGKVIVRPLPLWEPGGFTSATMGGTGTVITKQSRNVELAMKFLEYSKLTYDANVKIWTVFGLDPPRMDVYDDPELMKPDPFFANEQVMVQLKRAMERLVSKPVWPQHSELWFKISQESIFNVLEGTQTPEDALRDAAEEIRGKM